MQATWITAKAIIDFGALPLAIFLSTAVFYVAAHPTFTYLNKSWLRDTGKRAYAMYMIHAPPLRTTDLPAAIGDEAFSHLRTRIGYMLAMTFVSYALSVVSDRLIESPINRFKRHFSY